MFYTDFQKMFNKQIDCALHRWFLTEKKEFVWRAI